MITWWIIALDKALRNETLPFQIFTLVLKVAFECLAEEVIPDKPQGHISQTLGKYSPRRAGS